MLAGFLVRKVWDHVVKKFNNLGLAPSGLCLDRGQRFQKIIKPRLIKARSVLDDSDAVKACHIQRFLVGEELFKVLLARGVAAEKVARPFALGNQLRRTVTRFVFTRALKSLIAQLVQVTHGNVRKRGQVQVLAEVGEKNIVVATTLWRWRR